MIYATKHILIEILVRLPCGGYPPLVPLPGKYLLSVRLPDKDVFSCVYNLQTVHKWIVSLLQPVFQLACKLFYQCRLIGGDVVSLEGVLLAVK